MTRLLVLAGIMLAVMAIMNWLLSGGLLRVLIDVPVLWLLVLGLPAAGAVALLMPDRPRTIRVPVFVTDPSDEPRELHVHVHHDVTVQHVHSYQVRHDVRHHHDVVVRPQLAAPPGVQVVDGTVVGRPQAVRAIEKGR